MASLLRTFFRPFKAAGFTLVEVVIVIAVISILAATMAPLLAQQIDQAKEKATESMLLELAEALRSYHLDVGGFPIDTGNANTDLGRLTTDSGSAGWNGPYTTQKFDAGDFAKDAWLELLQYDYVTGEPTILLTSGGRDRTLGTSDDIQLTVLMDYDSVRKLVDTTYERLKLIAGDVYGNHPSTAPSSYTIPTIWQQDAWGNNIVYLYNNGSSAVVYSLGPDGQGSANAPDKDDIYYAMIWTPAGSGGSTTNSGNTSSSGMLTVANGSVNTCSDNETVSMGITNTGNAPLELTSISVSWTGGSNKNHLEAIEGGTTLTCGSGNIIWNNEDCGSPLADILNGGTIIGFCNQFIISPNSTFPLGDIQFHEKMKGSTITFTINHQELNGSNPSSSMLIITP